MARLCHPRQSSYRPDGGMPSWVCCIYAEQCARAAWDGKPWVAGERTQGNGVLATLSTANAAMPLEPPSPNGLRMASDRVDPGPKSKLRWCEPCSCRQDTLHAHVPCSAPGVVSGGSAEIRNPGRNPGPKKWKSGIRAEIRGRKSGNPESGQKSGPNMEKSGNPESKWMFSKVASQLQLLKASNNQHDLG